MKTIHQSARVALVILLTVCGCSPTSGPRTPTKTTTAMPVTLDIGSYTGGLPACLLVTDATGRVVTRAGGERCAQRFSPCSTFKIPNSLIGLETGVLTDATTVIPWDQDRYPQQAWWPPAWIDRVHDLRSAFANSFVPFYRALALRIGREAMERHLKRFGYGNQAIGAGLDSFWLDGTLQISAEEQVRFLRDFHLGRLGVSVRSTAIVREILVHERSGEYVLRAKTGTGGGEEGRQAIGWIVGTVEHGTAVHFYAFNVSAPTTAGIERQWRFGVLRAMLSKLGLWPRIEKADNSGILHGS
ncbi:MAG: class D beta-lactamase [Deltaproteobacteria bacterium HGW-Deltaproteobacteria-22]|nr:MAG: class D beta-lactamase [Deltaproteobacteria bacterium HGW-Deltaproteobacteria-22]